MFPVTREGCKGGTSSIELDARRSGALQPMVAVAVAVAVDSQVAGYPVTDVTRRQRRGQNSLLRAAAVLLFRFCFCCFFFFGFHCGSGKSRAKQCDPHDWLVPTPSEQLQGAIHPGPHKPAATGALDWILLLEEY